MDPRLAAEIDKLVKSDAVHKRIHEGHTCLCPICQPEMHVMLAGLYQDGQGRFAAHEGGEA